MTKNHGKGSLPSFARSPSGMLSTAETGISEKAAASADAATEIDDVGGVIPAQHCSHGSHGSHGSW